MALSCVYRSELENGGERRHRRRGRSPADLQLLFDTEPEASESRKKPAVMRYVSGVYHSEASDHFHSNVIVILEDITEQQQVSVLCFLLLCLHMPCLYMAVLLCKHCSHNHILHDAKLRDEHLLVGF